MMDTTLRDKTPMQPKTLAQLLPGIRAILSKNDILSLTAQKQARTTIAPTRTVEKAVRPQILTIAEINALRGPSPRRYKEHSTSSKVRPWNSSVKVDKTKSLTKDGHMKHSTVRKVLNFQSKSRPTTNPRMTMISAVPKPSVRIPAKTKATPRISGICQIPETPVLNKPLARLVPAIKVTNTSLNNNSDESFLQKEKEINDFEEKSNALTEERTLEAIAEISPPVSTPYTEYRNFRECLNNTNYDDSIQCENNTIMCFDKASPDKENIDREETVIVSLCDMLNKATVTNDDKNRELSDLNDVEKQAIDDIRMIDNIINILSNMKEKKLKLLQHTRKLKETENSEKCIVNIKRKSHIDEEENTSPDKTNRPTVIKAKSPSYKIPRRNSLRKKILYKSMPNVSVTQINTPNHNTDKAQSMYMQIKTQTTFLNTPLRKHRQTEAPDTPAVLKNNLKTQLDKLYN